MNCDADQWRNLAARRTRVRSAALPNRIVWPGGLSLSFFMAVMISRRAGGVKRNPLHPGLCTLVMRAAALYLGRRWRMLAVTSSQNRKQPQATIPRQSSLARPVNRRTLESPASPDAGPFSFAMVPTNQLWRIVYA